MKYGLTFVFFTLLCVGGSLTAAEYRIDRISPEYQHHWNWNNGPNRTVKTADCGNSTSLISRWRVKEKNSADFWHSMVNCRDMKQDGTLDSEVFRADHFEYSGSGNYKFSRASNQKLPVGVKLQYRQSNGVKKLIDFSITELPADKVVECVRGGTDAGWATQRTSSNHQIVNMYCDCGVLTQIDVYERKPPLSGYEISGVRTTCRLLELVE
jgi:hypothetical protein